MNRLGGWIGWMDGWGRQTDSFVEYVMNGTFMTGLVRSETGP